MRTAAYLPKVAQREMREKWKESGEREIGSRALEEARKIIAAGNPAHFDEEMEKKVLARFPEVEMLGRR